MGSTERYTNSEVKQTHFCYSHQHRPRDCLLFLSSPSCGCKAQYESGSISHRSHLCVDSGLLAVISILRARISAVNFSSPICNCLGQRRKIVSVGHLVLPKDDEYVSKASEFNYVEHLRGVWSTTVFEWVENVQDANKTLLQVSSFVAQARQVQQVSRSVIVVLVSSDPVFLSTFAEISLKGRLLVWSTRLLVLTRLPLHKLNQIRNTLAITNSMLILLSFFPSLRCDVYVELPYHVQEEPARVASWNLEQGVILSGHLTFFPDKFTRLQQKPQLQVARIVQAFTTKVINDMDTPGGKRTITWDPTVKMLETISEAMNFTFKFVTPSDRSYGAKLANGTWTGMIAMISRQDVDMGIGLFSFTALRAEVVDFTYPVTFESSKIVGSRGNPEVDPWGFILPLTPLVWMILFSSLIVLLTTLELLNSCSPIITEKQRRRVTNISSCVRVLLQQDVRDVSKWMWWKRLVLGTWMLTTLVLTRSYSGNLMSILAVRYIPMPVQSLQDIIDQPVNLLMMRGSAQVQTILEADSGILRRIANLQQEGRFEFYDGREREGKLLNLVRRGGYVDIGEETGTLRVISQYFSKTGRCDFYLARDKLLPMMSSMAGAKNSPLVVALSEREISVLVRIQAISFFVEVLRPLDTD
ncbi:hypothetical protein Pmani_018935 [Petrolisthes manimaculis]|uniref:Ionotropic glutamate receptor L-glutamate and glycine-binding domain-containing protein n=1 Tax=Petrolisthes manimaculis TaxID=1843537 RepID=A0AAE1U3Z9_9EUCA|nr:hypothetical protein Pmani_018935 [Petrolisthes manimaculis]